MMVARFTPAGRPDVSFAGDGIALVAPRGVDGGNPQASAYALALQPDGKIMLGGTGFSGVSWGSGFTVMRLTREGAPDATFGPGGGYFTPVGDGGGAQGSGDPTAAVRRGLPVRVRVSRPGTLSLRITAAAKKKPGRIVLATGSRRVLPGMSRVVLRPPRAMRSRLARMTPHRLRATLHAALAEAGGGQTEVERRVTLRRR